MCVREVGAGSDDPPYALSLFLIRSFGVYVSVCWCLCVLREVAVAGDDMHI